MTNFRIPCMYSNQQYFEKKSAPNYQEGSQFLNNSESTNSEFCVLIKHIMCFNWNPTTLHDNFKIVRTQDVEFGNIFLRKFCITHFV